ncbi:MAG: hypothetical protein KVP17_001595 [Porospora cf. gigantea B]|uniref:uncharacterized protein n=1 Tax=Porospora cf. gigantea B TaxID=2853592 RepID=UPI003571CDDB|nr:MAG: hypothetical protein KVP17_001595 [Porospora cf. gigantea B]
MPLHTVKRAACPETPCAPVPRLDLKTPAAPCLPPHLPIGKSYFDDDWSQRSVKKEETPRISIRPASPTAGSAAPLTDRNEDLTSDFAGANWDQRILQICRRASKLLPNSSMLHAGHSSFELRKEALVIRSQLSTKHTLQSEAAVRPSEAQLPVSIQVCTWNTEYSDPTLEDLLLPLDSSHVRRRRNIGSMCGSSFERTPSPLSSRSAGTAHSEISSSNRQQRLRAQSRRTLRNDNSTEPLSEFLGEFAGILPRRAEPGYLRAGTTGVPK